MAVIDTAQIAQRNELVAFVRAQGPLFSPRFADWLLTNWAMWLAFRDAGTQVYARGFRDYSAYVIVNVLRWRADVRGIKFSMSNTLIPDLARLYNARVGPLFKTSSRFGKETT
jgi:hypothetical protein